MVSPDLHVSCPHCGTPTATTTGTGATPPDRLKGSVESCPDCENAFELYYY